MKDLLKSLNNQQKEAVLNTKGPLLIMAGAGSGKTRVLTHRIAYLVQNMGVDPWSILAITFTNKAAREMKERIQVLLDGENSRFIWVSTFHSLCARILRREADKIGYDHNFSILDSSAQKTLIKHILNELNYDTNQYNPKAILSIISTFKSSLQTPKDALGLVDNPFDKAVAETYKLYEKRLYQSQSMDFDDLIMKTVRLFSKNRDILGFYQHRFRYINVDEYQDTNSAQYVLIKLLALSGSGSNNLAVVGDSDQSIYGWRGADINNILNFKKDFPSAKTILLEQNYRSTKNILRVANQVIKNNVLRKPKKLWTQNKAGELVHYYRAQSESDEANYVYQQIQLEIKKGHNLNDFAILFRTNAQSRIFEQVFNRHNLNYTVVGGTKFFDRKEIQDIVAYLQLIVNQNNNMAFERIVNEPKRSIGLKSLEKLRNVARGNDTSLMRAINMFNGNSGLSRATKNKFIKFANMIKTLSQQSETFSITDLVKKIFLKTGLLKQYEKQGDPESQSRVENLNEFLSQTKQFDEDYDPEISETGNPLIDFLNQTSLSNDLDSYDEKKGQVTLMTVHAAKGLEFPIVFIVGLEQGIFPSYRSMMEKNGLEEERRLAYVAITRAKKELFLSNAYSRLLYGRMQSNEPSIFINEIKDSLLKEENEDSNDIDYTNLYSKKDSSLKFIKEKSLKNKRALTKTYRRSQFLNRNKEDKVKDNRKNDNWGTGDLIKHKIFGIGRIVSTKGSGNDKILKVAFANKGIKDLMPLFAPIKKVKK